MAQQTQVSRVVPAYQRFLRRFPTPGACAAAPLSAVLQAWEGLGYNRRARDLHRTAVALVADHGGQVPADLAACWACPASAPTRPGRCWPSPSKPTSAWWTPTPDGSCPGRWRAGRSGPRRPSAWWTPWSQPAGAGSSARPSSIWERSSAWPALRCATTARSGGDAGGRHEGQAPPDPARALPVSRAGRAGSPVPIGRAGGGWSSRLRRGPVPADQVAQAAGWPEDPERADRIVTGLIDEGLVMSGPGRDLHLP